MPSPRHFAAFAAVALLAAGCGDAGKGKLNNRQANRLMQQVEAAQAAIDERKCGAARDAAAEGAELAAGFGRGVDTELQNNLVEGFNHLSDTVASECERPERSPTPTPSPTETPTEIATEPPVETPTPSPTPSPTETATEAPTLEPTSTPTSDTGGIPSNPDDDEDG